MELLWTGDRDAELVGLGANERWGVDQGAGVPALCEATRRRDKNRSGEADNCAHIMAGRLSDSQSGRARGSLGPHTAIA